MCNNDRKNKELPYNSRRVPIEIIMREREKNSSLETECTHSEY